MRLSLRLLALIVTVAAAVSPLWAQASPYVRPSPPAWLDLPPKALRQTTFDLFARHGRPFIDTAWQQHFNAQSWYKPDPSYRDDRMSDDERLTLRGVMGQRLKLARPGERLDRPLFQVERDLLKSSKAVDWRPLAWLSAANALCIIVFIAWRKSRLVTLIGFVATSALIYRDYQGLSARKSDVDVDTAYVQQGPITAIDHLAGTTQLALGDFSYSYTGRYPFRVGEMVTLAVSASGIVLQVNGNRAPVKPE